MLQLTRVVMGDANAACASAVRVVSTVTLSFEDRRRSRLRVRLDDGQEAALMLPRGTVLREGDLLAGPEEKEEGDGPMVRVRAAAETLSVARTEEPLLLSRGAYHLGNRHVPLQIGPGRLAYQQDHVLDELARALGLKVTTESAPFEPEAGGYPHQGSAHHGDHGHGHDHSHSHSHSHPISHSHSPLPLAGEGQGEGSGAGPSPTPLPQAGEGYGEEGEGREDGEGEEGGEGEAGEAGGKRMGEGGGAR